MDQSKRKRGVAEEDQIDEWRHDLVQTSLILAGEWSERPELLIGQWRLYSDPKGGQRAKTFESSHLLNATAGLAEASRFSTKLLTSMSLPEGKEPPRNPAKASGGAPVTVFTDGKMRTKVFVNFTSDGDAVHKVMASCVALPAWNGAYALVCRPEDVDDAIDGLFRARQWIQADLARR